MSNSEHAEAIREFFGLPPDVPVIEAEAGVPRVDNQPHAPDAAMSITLHIGCHWRGASDVHR